MRSLVASCVLSLLSLGLVGCSAHYHGYDYDGRTPGMVRLSVRIRPEIVAEM